jgi:hypothetical protein
MISWHQLDNEFERYPAASLLLRAYQSLPSSSPLLEYLMKAYGHFWEITEDDEASREQHLSFPPDLLLGLLKATQAARNDQLPDDEELRVPFDNEACQFHEHETNSEEEACPMKMQPDPYGYRHDMRRRRKCIGIV